MEKNIIPGLGVFGRFIFIIALALAGSVGTAQAQGGPIDRPLRPRTVDDAPPPLLPGAASDNAASAPVLEGALATQGQVAFQSYRDGNWEIYLGSADTLAARRLTNNSASDVEPKLSPDMSRIVFSSRRTGNYELFRIDASGNGLVQLTNHGATDSAATWSPDGQRIAFQSNRNGNSDVFVMNADGSGLIQLTTNADYDGEPAWSPNGAEIAFVSRRSSGDIDYFLYVMNADGTGQRLLTPVPYSSRPAWSLRGRRILFDGLDGSGWQRLYTYDFATGTVRAAGPVPGGNTDDLAGSWGGNDTIFFTRIYYVQYNGQWYISTMQVVSGIDGSNAGQRGLFGNVDGFPSWSNPDHVPPASFGYVSDPLIRRGASPFPWGYVLESGASGLEAQYRTNGGPWTSGDYGCVKYNEISWRCHLYPVGGTQVDIRVRGIDAFENRGDWSDDPEDWLPLQVYQRLILGSVRDQTGRGLLNIPVQGLTVLDPAVTTDEYGAFVAHQANADAFVVSATVGGQTASLTSDEIGGSSGGDVWADLRPAPVGNVLVNPGFDTPGAGWTPVNTLQSEWLSAGQASADTRVLRLSFANPASESPNYGMYPQVVVTGTTEYIAWYYGAMAFGVCQGADVPCLYETASLDQPRAMAIAPNGTVGVATSTFQGTMSFITRNPAGAWTAPEVLPNLGMPGRVQLLVDQQGRWHLLVSTNSENVVRITHRNDAGQWSNPVDIQYFGYGWKAVIDSSNVIHLIGCGGDGVVEQTWSSAIGYGLPNTISGEQCPGGYLGTQLDAYGQIYAVWVNDVGVARYMRRSVAGSWGALVPLTGATVAGNRVVGGNTGFPLVAVAESGGWGFRQASPDGIGWETLPWRAIGAFNPEAALLRYDTAKPAIMWAASSEGNYSAIQRQTLVSPETRVGMQQIVTIPADMHRPLLSTYYRFANALDGDSLAIGIQGSGDAQPTYLPLSSGPGWQRAWRDVSAWAGQTVTVTVQLTDGPDPSRPSADINEIYLGAYTTPSVTALEPNAFATPTGSFTITGTNFIATPTVTVGGIAAAVTLVDSQHLTVAVPPTLSPGAHRVVVSNLEGYAAIAPQTVIVGHALTLPVLMRWMPPDRP